MRIFTLGKNGIPLFFFALILFSGTYSSYGQCPTVNDDTQEFCDAQRATVASLQATANGEEVVWFNAPDAAPTAALPASQILTSGIYYAGTEAGPCPDESVTVTIVGPPEILGVKASNSFEPLASTKQSAATLGFCVADVNDPGIFVRDLQTNVDEANVTWYRSNDPAAEELDVNDPLENGTYYAEYHDPILNCTTTRSRVTISLFSEPAPTGPSTQTFCESDNPTLANIDASGTNRYYTTETGGAELSETTVLEVGTAIYYVSSFGETCESTNRLQVTVTVNPAVLVETTDEFCGSIGTGNDFHAPRVGDLRPEGVNWFADQALTIALDPMVELDTETVYYYDPIAGDCSVTGVEITILDNPNAGRTTQESFCENAGIVNLVDYIEPSTVSGPADTNGSFNHPAFNGGTSFNTEDLEPGVYNLTYSVPGNENCPGDTSSFELTIQDAPEAGADITETVCSAILMDTEALTAQFSSYLEGRDLNGTFDVNNIPGVETFNREEVLFALFGLYNQGVRTFLLTYNVAGTPCSDSAQISLTVLDSPDAGDGGNIQLIANTANTITLAEAMQGTPEDGGTWTGPNGTPATDDFAPQEAGAYTYTVTSQNGCTSSSTVTVRAVQQDCPVVSDTTQEFCSSISTEDAEFKVPTISDLEPASASWYASEISQDALAPDFELENGGVYYAGNPAGNCTDRASVTVTILAKPNAGKTTHAYFCETEAPVNLVDFIEESITGAPSQNGSFSPALEGNIFDPAAFGPGTYSFTYTVPGNEDCLGDSSSTTVTVLATPDAGVDVDEEFCINANTPLPTAEEFMDLYEDDSRDQSGTFTPTLDELAAAFATNPFGTFTTVYTVTTPYTAAEKSCTDTATLSVRITEELPAEAGENVEADVCSTAGVQNLSDFLSEGAIQGGVFSSPYEDGTFDPSTAGTDPVEITYTVNSENACVSGEAISTITLTVIPGPDAGENGEITLNVTDSPVNLFASLGGTPDEGGTWAPGNANGDLDPSTLAAGTYSYEYTVTSENDCQDIATVSVTIEGELTCPEVTESTQTFCESILSGNDSRKPRVSDLLPAGATWYATATATEALPATTELVNGTTYYAGNSNGTCEDRQSVTVTLNDSPNAGGTTSETFCESGEPVDLLTVLNSSIIGAPDSNGTFSPALASGTTIFDPSVDAAGTYTYTVPSNGVCDADSAVINITITPNANAGGEFEVEFCATQDAVNLTESLPEGVDTNGTFEGLEGNMFDPATFGVGTHEFNYTVTVEGDCESTDTAEVTVIVTEAPAAPAAEAQSFCVVEAATVADLVAGEEGDALLWYTDQTLETLADEADALEEGTYYVTSTTDGGCESAATAVVVTFTDAATPTLTAGGNVFCEFDDPTIATLAVNVSGGSITWYDAATGGNTLSTTEPLQNGVTYYAASTDATSACESSVRLAVTVTLEECEAIIPDAFSPNNDKINDTFVVDNLREKYPNFTIEIFNRWGNVVYKGNASTPDWDGVSTESRSLGDDVLPVGVYFYIVNYNDGQTAPTQGRLYLSR